MSEKTDILLFDLLKKEVSATLRKGYPGNHENISHWKGQEIKCFQDDLMEKVQSRISEKWFYTHLKSENNGLPRVDILNLLSKYCGYQDWLDFRVKNKRKISQPIKLKFAIPLIAILVAILWFSFSTRYYVYELQVIDAITLESIHDNKLEVIWLKENESPTYFQKLEEGKLTLESEKREITIVIRAPYYQTDTIRRKIPFKNYHEKISLQPDDFSLMVHFFSTSNVKEWEKYRKHLDQIFAYNATIFQVDENGMGMGIFNKEEFIDRLSFPLSKLKNIEVLETRVYKDKIVFLRFKLPENEK